MPGVVAVSLGLALLTVTLAHAEDCPGNPDALGTSRVLVIDPVEHPHLGLMQYDETLPLADKEVVLTFDDGPLVPYSTRVLDILAAECVKATYFLVGRMAKSYPDTARRIAAAGHTIGTHSQSHPIHFNRLSQDAFGRQIDDGIVSVTSVLGSPSALAPFFRIPGLRRTDAVDAGLAARALVAWSADVVADDWYRRATPTEIIAKAIRRLEERSRGILLLHDIHPMTVEALPGLLWELKERGFRVVHVVPAGPDRPKTATAPEQWTRHAGRPTWPRAQARIAPQPTALPAPDVQMFAINRPPSPRPPFPTAVATADGTIRHSRWPERRFTPPYAPPQLPAPGLPAIGMSLEQKTVVGEAPLGLRPSLDVIGPNARSALAPPRASHAEATGSLHR